MILVSLRSCDEKKRVYRFEDGIADILEKEKGVIEEVLPASAVEWKSRAGKLFHLDMNETANTTTMSQCTMQNQFLDVTWCDISAQLGRR